MAYTGRDSVRSVARGLRRFQPWRQDRVGEQRLKLGRPHEPCQPPAIERQQYRPVDAAAEPAAGR
jgi:hypothetical protein